MSRVPITEYAAKRLVLGEDYRGMSVTPNTLNEVADSLEPNSSYVVKVDVGIKKRGKQGLLIVNVPAKEVVAGIEKLFKLGHDRCLVETMVPHDESEEKYVSLDVTRDGVQVLQSENGGIEVEKTDPAAITRKVIARTETLSGETSFSVQNVPLNSLLDPMQEFNISFLEINPYIVKETTLHALDMAAEIDSTKVNRLPEWTKGHILNKKATSDAELKVLEQDARTQAALNLHTLNPNGSVLTLFSGGGASLVALDSLVTAGLSEEVINYSEYSGAPTRDETAEYVRTLLSVLFDSKAPKKVVLVAGGVANFTDVRETFNGIIDAFTDELAALKKQKVGVVVRRGGPNQVFGLASLEGFLEENDIPHEIHDPSLSLGSVGELVSKYL